MINYLYLDRNMKLKKYGGYVFSDSENYLLYSLEDGSIVYTGELRDTVNINTIIDSFFEKK